MSTDATFHFAWVDASETTFDPESHAREDEDIFGFTIAQNENEFASADVQLRRPEEGLLNPLRQQYIWISVTYTGGTVPLFFGRVVGLPIAIDREVATLKFVAQFPGWEDDRAALFATLKVAPFWDTAFTAADDLDDPDQALEARTAFYHYHRTTGAITLSDILAGGTTVSVSDHFEDSLSFEDPVNPARKITVTAKVEWEQNLTGETDSVHTQILKAFDGGRVNTFTPDSIERAWPKVGDTVGGQSGYTVRASRIQAFGDLPSTMAAESESYKIKVPDAEQAIAKAVLNATQATRDAKLARKWYDTALGIAFDFRQPRTETLTFTLVNDVQALAFGADGGEITINLTAEDVVGLGLIQAHWSTYFLAPAGKASFHYLLARAQAAAAAAARAVEIKFERPFFAMLDMSCDHNVILTDASLAGGVATGKVKSYSLALDGDTGAATGEITLGVSVGNGESYTASGAVGDYCTVAYVGLEYQMGTGETFHPDLPAVIYDDYSSQVPADPAIIGRLRNDNLVLSLAIENGPDAQEVLLQDNQHPVRDDAANVVNQNPTTIALELRSLQPFDDVEHTITVTLPYPWAAPKGIDLAA